MKRVVDGAPICKGDNSQSSPTELIQHSPESDPAVRLYLDLQGLIDNADAELASRVRTFAKDCILEVARNEYEAIHVPSSVSPALHAASVG